MEAGIVVSIILAIVLVALLIVFAVLCKTGFITFSRRKDFMSEDDIKDIVDDAEELLDDEKRMINEILDLGDMVVREIMQPRVDIIMAEENETVHTVISRMQGTGYSRLPVYHQDYDQIFGLVHLKDLVPAVIDGKEEEAVGKLAHDVMLVPETKKALPLLSEMQASHCQMVIVIDEYGGTAGIVTIEDIVEEIIGEIVDESDPADSFVTTLSETVILVDGRLPLKDALEMGWPVTDLEDCETIAGWMMEMLDAIPRVGYEYELEGYSFRIQKMRRHRISLIKVTLPKQENEARDG